MGGKLISYQYGVAQHLFAFHLLHAYAFAIPELVQGRILTRKISQPFHDRKSNSPHVQTFLRHGCEIENSRSETVKLRDRVLLDQPARHHRLQETARRAGWKPQTTADLKKRLLGSVRLKGEQQIQRFLQRSRAQGFFMSFHNMEASSTKELNSD